MNNYIKTTIICIALSFCRPVSSQELYGIYNNYLNHKTYDIFLTHNKSWDFSLYINAMAVDNTQQQGGIIINQDQFFSFRLALDYAITEYREWIKKAKANRIVNYSTGLSFGTSAQAYFKTDKWNVDLETNIWFTLNILPNNNDTIYMISLNTDSIISETHPSIQSKGFVIAFNTPEELEAFSDQLTGEKIKRLLTDKGATVAVIKNNDLTQETQYPILGIGLKLGSDFSIGMNNKQSSNSDRYTAKTIKPNLIGGFAAGFATCIEFKKWYLQPEVFYSMGLKNYFISFWDFKYRQVDLFKSVNMMLLDVPLLVGYKVRNFQRSDFRVFAGPKLRMNLGSKISYPNLTYPQNRNVVDPVLLKDLSTNTKPFTVGLNLGAEIHFEHSSLGVNYNLMDDIYKTKIAGYTIDNTMANSIGISFTWHLFDNQKN